MFYAKVPAVYNSLIRRDIDKDAKYTVKCSFSFLTQISWYFFNLKSTHLQLEWFRERSGSVLECSTRGRGAAGSSLTGVTALWSLSKTHLSFLSTGSTQEDPSLFNWKIVDGT